MEPPQEVYLCLFIVFDLIGIELEKMTFSVIMPIFLAEYGIHPNSQELEFDCFSQLFFKKNGSFLFFSQPLFSLSYSASLDDLFSCISNMKKIVVSP